MTEGSGSGPWITGPPPPPPEPEAPEPEESPTEVMGEQPPDPGRPRHARADWLERMRALADRARLAAPHMVTDSLYLVAAGTILVAYAFAWLYAILDAIRHQPGISAQTRTLELFYPGNIEWALLVLVGTLLAAVGRRLDMSASGKPAEIVLTGLLIAAALTVLAAVFGVLVDLTNFGHGIDLAFLDIVARLAAIPVAAGAGWWAWQLREELKPLP